MKMDGYARLVFPEPMVGRLSAPLHPHGRNAARLFAILIPLLAGCAASQVPQAIRAAPAKPHSVSEVQRDPDRFIDERVRWGGSIIAVRNREKTTEIEILSRPLDSHGEPREEVSGKGRFVAQLAGFADPTAFPERRQLTMTGRILRLETRPIGEYPYRYPVVAVEHYHLWPEQEPTRPVYYPDPWFYPWYRPWHPWYGHWYY